MTDTKKNLSEFQSAVGKVRPVVNNRITPEPSKPPPIPSKSLQHESSVVDELSFWDALSDDLETGEEISFIRTGVALKTFKKLKRGEYGISAELDLHHMLAEAAFKAINEFIHEAITRNIVCVRIIHGKGLRSKHNGPILKKLVNSLLRKKKNVLAFASAKPADGGTGAVSVLLRRKS